MFRNLFDHPAFLLVLVVLVVVIFGAKRLPGAAQSLGRSMKIFKSEVKDLKDDKPAATADGATAASETAAPRPLEGRVVDADHAGTGAGARVEAPAARTSVEDVDDAEAARRWRESQRHSA